VYHLVWMWPCLFWDPQLAWQRVTRFSLKPKSFDMKIFWTNAVILIEKTYNGILSQQFIIGIFNATVFSDTPLFTLHPLRDRLLNRLH